jgi:hypothetical protein
MRYESAPATLTMIIGCELQRTKFEHDLYNVNDSIKSQRIAFSLMPFDTAKGCVPEETPFRL